VDVALRRCAEPTDRTRVATARSLFDFCTCVVAAPAAPPPAFADRAARVAVRAHRLDQDDLHLGSISHPGGIVWSAVADCALAQHATWGEAGSAAVLGYELMVRLAEGLGTEHRRRWHVTATAGVVGAAGASARLLGGDAAVLDAVGHATSVASGSAQAQHERSGTLLVHRAFAAATGVACARAACSGLAGNRFGLEGGRGALQIEAAAIEPLVADRPTTALEETGFRLHAATGFAQAAIDAALLVGPIPPEEIAHVNVIVSPPLAGTVASNPAPETDEDAWWSIEHAVALCLATGGTGALARGLTDRADVLRLCRDTTIVGNEAGWGASVEVVMRDERVERATATGPLGHGSRPASDDDLCAKWLRLVGSDGSSFLRRLRSAAPDASFESVLGDFATVLEAA
jgi:2-methylcitrate dehydratase PrpD